MVVSVPSQYFCIEANRKVNNFVYYYNLSDYNFIDYYKSASKCLFYTLIIPNLTSTFESWSALKNCRFQRQWYHFLITKQCNNPYYTKQVACIFLTTGWKIFSLNVQKLIFLNLKGVIDGMIFASDENFQQFPSYCNIFRHVSENGPRGGTHVSYFFERVVLEKANDIFINNRNI